MHRSQIAPALMSFSATVILFIAAAWIGGWSWVVAVIAILLNQYWLGPFIIWAVNRFPILPWTRVENGSPKPPDPLHRWLTAMTERLEGAGFVPAGVVTAEGLAPGYTTWLATFLERSQETRAGLFSLVPENAALPRSQPALSFVTRFQDGHRVETSNAVELPPFPAPPGADLRSFPNVRDVKTLLRVHKVRLAPYGNATRQKTPLERVVDVACEAHGEYWEAQARAGCAKVVQPGRLYRPTLRGAFRATWTLLEPMKGWLLRRRESRNADFLRRLGILDGPRSQSVVIRLPGSGLPDDVYETCDVATLEEVLVSVLRLEEKGTLDGHETGPDGTTIFISGPDAELTFAAIEPALRGYPLARNAVVAIRTGDDASTERTVHV